MPPQAAPCSGQNGGAGSASSPAPTCTQVRARRLESQRNAWPQRQRAQRPHSPTVLASTASPPPATADAWLEHALASDAPEENAAARKGQDGLLRCGGAGFQLSWRGRRGLPVLRAEPARQRHRRWPPLPVVGLLLAVLGLAAWCKNTSGCRTDAQRSPGSCEWLLHRPQDLRFGWSKRHASFPDQLPPANVSIA
jgi:hypothetical protein